jgi:hypothetical protein
MKIDKRTLKQIIKEELDNVLMEQDFDYDTGFPITSAGAKKALNNPKTMERIEQIGPNFVKIIKWAVKASADDVKYPEEKISKTLKDYSKASVEKLALKKRREEIRKETEDIKKQGEEQLKRNRANFNDKEIKLAEKYIDAFTRDKQKFLKQIEEIGEENYTKSYPNWPALKKMMVDMYDKLIQTQRDHRDSVGNRGFDSLDDETFEKWSKGKFKRT